ncbi:MAG: PIN domain-containing protein [Bacteroidia bacterium]
MSRIILDTNILVYGLDAQSGYYASAVAILTNPAYELSVPTKVISEFFAVCSKLNVGIADSMKFYQEVQKNTTTLYPTPASLGHFEQLIQKYQPRGNRVFDLEIVSVAMANDIPQIATANLNDFQGMPEIGVLALVAK